MAHQNYGFTSSKEYVNQKQLNIATIEAGNEKYTPKDGTNGFTAVELGRKMPKVSKGDEEDYDPYANRDIAHPTTYWDTLFHMIKGSLGTGILAMPKAFYNAGYVVGIIGTIVIGLLCTHCIRVLILSHYELCKRKRVPKMRYPETMQAALEEGPKPLRKFSKFSYHLCNLFMMVYQLGTCSVYTMFIADNMKSAMDLMGHKLSVEVWTAIILLPLILINWLRNLKILAPLSTGANFLTFFSFGIILYIIFSTPLSFEGRHATADFKKFPLFLGTVLFSLEAIGVIMPLENEMRKPRGFIKLSGVLNIGMLLNIILYVGMGLLGYLQYGDKVEGTITLNLGDSILSIIVQLLLAIAILISHALQCYVAIDIAWGDYIKDSSMMRNKSPTFKLVSEYAIRTIIVLFCFTLAITIPQLELFISLVGALCLSAVGISFPAIIQTCAFWEVETIGGKIYLILKNTAVVLFGILGLVVGTYTSINGIIEKMSESN